ncbi:hypothetical protein Cma02nite_23080 [Cellulomonas marina]|nr:hypothetical protein Cma02nite_23080 [Cellulomonas marina]
MAAAAAPGSGRAGMGLPGWGDTGGRRRRSGGAPADVGPPDRARRLCSTRGLQVRHPYPVGAPTVPPGTSPLSGPAEVRGGSGVPTVGVEGARTARRDDGRPAGRTGDAGC